MRTLWGPDGARYITAASPGALCLNTGAVPAARSRVDWQQGVGIITRVGDRAFHEVHAILDGVALIDGALYEAAPARYLSDLRTRWPGFAWGPAD